MPHPHFSSLNEYVDAMIRGRIPTRAEFTCPECSGPARAWAGPRGDLLWVSVRCPCSALEYDGAPKWPQWEQLLAPPSPDFNPNPLSLRSDPGRDRNPFAGDTRAHIRQVPCPYCGSPIGDKAKQCFVCGTNWHDPGNVVNRKNPDWNRFGLKWESDYVVELCQDPAGTRYTKYRELGAPGDPHRVHETPPHPGRQWVAWGFYTYAQFVTTTTGEKFTFDAHGIWLTWTEVQWLHRAIKGEVRRDQIPWSTTTPPTFPPA